MPLFRYTATNSDGTPVDGVIEAADMESAKAALSRQGLSVESVTAATSTGASVPASGATASASSAASGSQVPPSHSQTAASLSVSERVEVLGQLGVMMDSGLPLSVGLRTLAEETGKPALRRSFVEMSSRLDAGRPLDDVVREFGNAMPDWLLQMIRSGTESGTLTRSVAHYVQFTRLRNRLRGRVLTALAYPFILLAVLGAISVGLFGYLLPQFKQIFEGFGVELPAVTLVLIQLSDFTLFFLTNAVVTVPVALLIVLGGSVAFRAIVGPATTRRVVYEIPLLGRALKLTGLSEFCHLLALLIENRVPLPRALSLVGSAMRDPCLSQCADDAAHFVERGESLAAAQARLPNLPVELLRIPGWDQPDESLPQALRASGEIFASQCDVNARAMAGAATPVVILLIGALAIITVGGLFMPLIKLLNDLS
ncbi:hypothetical protein GC176_02700 [bacterium]|nr:hypothetical protein [bacterium]